jgi:hypothetical protein
MRDAHDWRPLSEIWLRDLPQSLPIPFRDRQSAIANAVLSGEVAVRGQPVGGGLLGEWGVFDRIEKTPGLVISVMENAASGVGVRYVQVEADLAEVTKWIHENALPAGYAAGEEKVDEIKAALEPKEIDSSAAPGLVSCRFLGGMTPEI